MTDEEFNALPDYSDIEFDPTYDGFHDRGPSFSPESSASHVLAPPPGLSPTPHFVGLHNQDASSFDLNGPAGLPGTTQDTSPVEFNNDDDSELDLIRGSPSFRDNPIRLLGSSRTTQKPTYAEILRGNNPYHVGDGLPPRDPRRQSIARDENGQRRVWIVTPGRWTARRRGHHCLPETYSSSPAEPSVFLRGGSGEESMYMSHHDVPFRCRPPMPWPCEWLQLLSQQGDHNPRAWRNAVVPWKFPNCRVKRRDSIWKDGTDTHRPHFPSGAPPPGFLGPPGWKFPEARPLPTPSRPGCFVENFEYDGPFL